MRCRRADAKVSFSSYLLDVRVPARIFLKRARETRRGGEKLQRGIYTRLSTIKRGVLLGLR